MRHRETDGEQMKKAIIIFAALLLQVGVFAQASVPANIQKAFKTKYAKAEQIDWVIGDFFVATFWEGDFYREATYAKSGEWNSTATVLEESNLPEQVSEKLKANLGDTFITYIIKVIDEAGETYVIDLSTETENLQVTTDLEGNTLKKIVVEAGDDD